MFVLGILIFLALIVFMALLSAQDPLGVSMLIDTPTAFFYVGTMFSVVIATKSFKTFVSTINAVLSKNYYISGSDKEKAIRLFKLLAKISLIASSVSTLVGLITLLTNLSDIRYLGPSIAVAILPILGGLCVNLIFIHPTIYLLESRSNIEEKTVITEKEVVNKLFELCYKQGITPEEILDAKEISFTE